ncbi:hypothetical protein CDAR_296421 [Caerostris darwini]|uniref:Uncharacterized protein n=1 Tax=Caerostris darwini TaxID=1538125 RepID=A0AAV4PNI3_9ARAC|nr:hypothetical protein CDAR_296421 [Caerostris darwini]
MHLRQMQKGRKKKGRPSLSLKKKRTKRGGGKSRNKVVCAFFVYSSGNSDEINSERTAAAAWIGTIKEMVKGWKHGCMPTDRTGHRGVFMEHFSSVQHYGNGLELEDRSEP